MSTVLFVLKIFTLNGLKSYVKKEVVGNKDLLKAVQTVASDLPGAASMNGKTIWKDENLRIDLGNNTLNSNVVHMNLQKNKGCKIPALSRVATDKKLMSMCVTVGAEVDNDDLEECFEKGFNGEVDTLPSSTTSSASGST